MLLYNNMISGEYEKDINFSELNKFKRYVIKNNWSRKKVRKYIKRYILECIKNTLKNVLNTNDMSIFTIHQYKKATVERGAVQYKNITNYLQSNKILFDKATYTPLFHYNFDILKTFSVDKKEHKLPAGHAADDRINENK